MQIFPLSDEEYEKAILSEEPVHGNGAIIHFDVTWPPNKLKEDDMAQVILGSCINGLGARSLGYGRFFIAEMLKCTNVTLDVADTEWSGSM